VLPTIPLTLEEYEDDDGDSPFADWFNDVPVAAPTRMTMALARMERGDMGDAKSVGNGVIERRIDHGPGYRIYLGRDGATLVILLAGATKQRQDRDIETAKQRWADYLQRKQEQDKPTCH